MAIYHKTGSGLSRTLRLALLTSTMLAVAGTSYAQDAAPADETPAEITVTATKRNTKIQKTPMAITAVTGETLEKTGAVSLDEYAKFVPSLKVSEDGPGRGRISLRGIQGSGESLVGVFYDETPITGSVGVSSDAGGRSPDTTANDVQRIEVLRGPQGTLFGGSTMGGAIRMIFKKPTKEYEGFVTGSYATTEGGDPSWQVTGMVNVPLADKLAARVVMYDRENGGWLDNNFLNKENINESSVKGGRMLLRYTPLDNLTLDAAVYIQNTEAVSNNNWNPAYGDYVQASKLLLPYEEDTKIYSLTANWDVGSVRVTGNTSYFISKSVYAADDTNYVAGYRTTARCTAFLGVTCTAGTQTYTDYLAYVNSYYPAAIYYPSETRNWTNEIRVSSNTGGALSWTLGAYYENRFEYIQSSDVLADEASGLLLEPIEFIYHRYINDRLKQKALFGEVTYDFTPKFHVTAGARYFEYEKSVGGETDIAWLLIGAPLRPYTEKNSKEDGTIFKLNASYDFSSDIMAYANFSQGFRPGGVNQVIGLPDALTPYDSDSLNNYELGIKTAWFNRMLYVNAAIYQIDWDNMQVSGRTLNNAFSFISNAGAARVKGFELEASATPITGLTLSGNVSYNDAVLTEDQVNANVSSTGRAGDRIVNIPREKGAVTAEYTHPVGSDLSGYIRGDVNYVGVSYSELRPTNVYRMKNPAYTLVNARVGLKSGKGWDASLYVNNLLDHVAIFRLSNSATTPIGGSAISAMPRTVGVSVTKRF